MFSLRRRWMPAACAALCLAGSIAVGPSLAWSPLQYDTKEEVNTGLPARTMYQELMGRVKKDMEAAPEAAPADAPPGAPTAVKLEDREAQSAIEGDAASDNVDGANDEWGPSERKEATLIPSTKQSGKQPSESINDPRYFYKKAQAFAESGDFQSALNYVNRALVLNPQMWEAWYEKGLVYQLAGYDAAAARRYLALLERKPDMLAAHIALGMLYRKHSNRDLAEAEYRQSLEYNYRYFPAHYNLANLMMDEGRLDLALKEYKICLKLQPDNAQVHNNLGVIYQKRNYLEEAVAEFTAASHLDPANQGYVENMNGAKAKIGAKPPRDLSL